MAKSLHSFCYVIEFCMNLRMSAIILCVLILGVFFFLKTGRESDTEREITGSSFLEDIRIVQKKKGAITWILTAKRADFPEREDSAELRSVGLAIPDSSLMLRTESGSYDFSANTFASRTPVQAEGENYRIVADALDFDISTAGVQTDGRVRLEGKGFSLEGEGMQAGKEQRVRIFRDVKAIFQN